MKTFTKIEKTIIGILFSALAGVTHAAPVFWSSADGGNDHWYDIIHYRSTWDDAQNHVQSQTYQGMQGHLVTLTSEAEHNFVWNNFQASGYWLGGYQTNKNDEPAGNWAWVTGEQWDYSKWIPGEPNDALGNEEKLQFHWSINDGWNDMHNHYLSGSEALYNTANPDGGYIVEYGTYAVPEPSLMFLFGMGLLGLAGNFGLRKSSPAKI